MDPKIGESTTLYISTKRTRSILTTNLSSRPEKGFAVPQHQAAAQMYNRHFIPIP
jgi:hypothetical protein